MPVRENGRFIEPMLLLRTDALPNDADRWEYQLKLDGYRAIAFKTAGKLHLRSRNNNDFSLRYSGVVKGSQSWTSDNHLRHSKFIGLCEEKTARDVRPE